MAGVRQIRSGAEAAIFGLLIKEHQGHTQPPKLFGEHRHRVTFARIGHAQNGKAIGEHQVGMRIQALPQAQASSGGARHSRYVRLRFIREGLLSCGWWLVLRWFWEVPYRSIK